jgi:putative zinc finger protein
MESEGHLESRDVAAYVDRALSPAERDVIEAHLSDCADCRNEVVQVSRLRRIASSRRQWLFVVPIAAAAALAVMLLPSRKHDEPVLRDGGEPVLAVTIVAPADSAQTPSGAPQVSFTWRSLDSVVSYRFAITDGSGDVVWSATSTDTTVQLPASIQLRPGNYFWYVDALLPDGRSVASRVRTLRATR